MPQTDVRPLLSVVVPIFCEESGLREFYSRIKAVLVGLGGRYRHEIVFVEDGSTDASPQILRALADEDPGVRVVCLSRNFGHQVAISAGIDEAAGDLVVVIDGDLQDPPEVVPELVARWEEGFRVVYAVRRRRKGEGLLKLWTARWFYRLLQRLGEVRPPLDTGDFRLMDRVVVDVLRGMREQARYIRGLVSWVGFRQTGVLYDRDPRHSGTTKFSMTRMVRFALDGITSFSALPLRLASHLGLLTTAAAVLLGAYLMVMRVLDPSSSVRGWTSLMVVILFMGGVQLLSVGILGEYVSRIFSETKGRPLYVVAETLGTSQLPARQPRAAGARVCGPPR